MRTAAVTRAWLHRALLMLLDGLGWTLWDERPLPLLCSCCSRASSLRKGAPLAVRGQVAAQLRQFLAETPRNGSQDRASWLTCRAVLFRFAPARCMRAVVCCATRSFCARLAGDTAVLRNSSTRSAQTWSISRRST